MSSEKCDCCGHSLEDNPHGFDQNDFDWEENPVTGEMELVHSGHCTYCVECNPGLKAMKDAKKL